MWHEQKQLCKMGEIPVGGFFFGWTYRDISGLKTPEKTLRTLQCTASGIPHHLDIVPLPKGAVDGGNATTIMDAILFWDGFRAHPTP